MCEDREALKRSVKNFNKQKIGFRKKEKKPLNSTKVFVNNKVVLYCVLTVMFLCVRKIEIFLCDFFMY